MKDLLFRAVFALLIGALVSFSSLACADDDASGGGGGLSDATKAGIGCLAATGGVLGAALIAGPNELVMVAAGGTLVPSATGPLMVGLVATVLTATCSFGIAATPFALWLSEQVGTIFNGLWGEQAAPAAAVKSPN